MSKHIFLFLKEGTKIEEKEGIITGKWAGLYRRKLHRLIITMHFNFSYIKCSCLKFLDNVHKASSSPSQPFKLYSKTGYKPTADIHRICWKM